MSFSRIRGHDSAISFLKRSITDNRLANAYIFSGPSGIGKKLIALNFAKAVNCDASGGDGPCGACPSCRKIDLNSHPDVHVISPEKGGASVKIDDVRAVIRDISLKPYEAKVKVYIVDEADNLTEEAANALLKTLEEPSPRSALILIAQSVNHLLPTIRSRCQTVKFFPLDMTAVEEILSNLYGVDRIKARILARISGGSPGEALFLNDDVFFNKRENLIRALSSGMFSDMDFDKTPRNELKILLNIMLTWYRDVMAAKAGNAEVINIDKKDIISTQAKRIGFDDLNSMLKRIISTQTYLDQNANPKLAMAALGLGVP